MLYYSSLPFWETMAGGNLVLTSNDGDFVPSSKFLFFNSLRLPVYVINQWKGSKPSMNMPVKALLQANQTVWWIQNLSVFGDNMLQACSILLLS